MLAHLKICWLQKTLRKTLLDTKCFRTICISAMYCIIQALWLDHTMPVSKLLNHIPRDIYFKYWLHRLVGEGIVGQYCGTTAATHGTPSTYKPFFPSDDNSLWDNISPLVIISPKWGESGAICNNQTWRWAWFRIVLAIKYCQGWELRNRSQLQEREGNNVSDLTKRCDEDFNQAICSEAAVACQSSVSASLSEVSTLCPTYCDAQIYWKVVDLLVL